MSKIAEKPFCHSSLTRETPRRIFLWPIIFGAVVCDLLGLCHLLPSHSQHLYRPYMLSMVQFKVFGNQKLK